MNRAAHLSTKSRLTYSYNDAAHRHAVTWLSNGASFGYDANGNMTQRNLPGQNYSLAYDGENHLTAVSGAATAGYVYDGDGKRIIANVNGNVTIYIGNYFEWDANTSEVTRYYYAGSQRIAMRKPDGTKLFILDDHLGGSNRMVDENANAIPGELQLYKPWGEGRGTSSITLTKYQYTGQFNDSYINLYWMNSRWYDPALGRWIQPDPIVPLESQGTQAWDRFAYVNNNAVKYTDPSGHCIWDLCAVETTALVVIAATATTVAVSAYYAAGGPEAVAASTENLLNAISEQINETVQQLTNLGEEQTYQASNNLLSNFARPRNNEAQNKQFDAAVRELERYLGRSLTPDEIRELHEALHHLEDPGYKDIVDEGKNLFDQGDDSDSDEDEEGGDR